MLSVSIVDKVLLEKLWPAWLKTQGCFVFLPDDVLEKKEKY